MTESFSVTCDEKRQRSTLRGVDDPFLFEWSGCTWGAFLFQLRASFFFKIKRSFNFWMPIGKSTKDRKYTFSKSHAIVLLPIYSSFRLGYQFNNPVNGLFAGQFSLSLQFPQFFNNSTRCWKIKIFRFLKRVYLPVEFRILVYTCARIFQILNKFIY